MKVVNNLGMGLLAGVVLFAMGALFHVLTPLLVPSIPIAYRDHPEVFRPWLGWTRPYMALYPFAYGLAFAWVFRIAHDTTKENSPFHGVAGGAVFGFLVFLVGSLPVFLLNYASFKVPAVIIASWVIQSLAQYVAAGPSWDVSPIGRWFEWRQA